VAVDAQLIDHIEDLLDKSRVVFTLLPAGNDKRFSYQLQELRVLIEISLDVADQVDLRLGYVVVDDDEYFFKACPSVLRYGIVEQGVFAVK
jgi:hypothetical protein